MSSIFGGGVSKASKESQKAQAAANAATQRFIEEKAGLARQDVSSLFPQAQDVSRQGFQGALDLFGQSLPAQADIFQQGNIGAQQQLASTLPQFQRAIMGQPVDFSQFQPQTLSFDPSFLQGQQAPQMQAAAPQQQGALGNIGRFNFNVRPPNPMMANIRGGI